MPLRLLRVLCALAMISCVGCYKPSLNMALPCSGKAAQGVMFRGQGRRATFLRWPDILTGSLGQPKDRRGGGFCTEGDICLLSASDCRRMTSRM